MKSSTPAEAKAFTALLNSAKDPPDGKDFLLNDISDALLAKESILRID